MTSEADNESPRVDRADAGSDTSDAPVDETPGPSEGQAGESATGEAPTRRRRPVRFVTRVVALFVLLALFGSWYWLESARGTEWLRTSLETWGSSMVGAPLRIGSLELDLVPFRARLEDVAIRPQEPTAATATTVDVITIELSTLGLLQRRVVVTELELVRPRVHLVIPTPRPRDRVTDVVDAVGPLSIDLQRVRVVDGELSWLHRTTRIDGAVTGVSVTIAPDVRSLANRGRRGRLRIAGGRLDLSARNGSASLLAPVVVEARFAPQPAGITVDSLRVDIGSSRVEGSGEVHGAGTADIDLRGEVAIDDVFAFWRPPGPDDHDGTIRFDGTLQLRDGSPLLAGSVSGESLRLSGLDVDRLQADVQLRAAAIALRNIDADLLGGSARGELVVDRSAMSTTTTMTYTLEGLDAARLTSWEALPGWRFAGTAGGSGRVSWSGTDLASVSGDGTLEIDVVNMSFPRSTPAAPSGADAVALAPGRGTTATTGAGPSAPEAAAVRTPGRDIPSLPLPARGRLEYGIRSGRLQIDNARLSLPGTELTASGRIDPSGELLVFTRAQSSDLRMLDHLAAQLRGFLAGEAVSRFGVAGRGSVELRLAGRSDRPTIGGSVTGERLRVQDVEMGSFEGTLRSEGPWLYADDLRVAGGLGTARGTARLRLGAAESGPGDDYALTMSLQDFGLAMDLALPSGDQPLTGRTGGELTIRGRYGAPVEFQIDVAIDEPSLAGQLLDRAVVVATRRDRIWTLERLGIDGLGGSITASGEIRPSDRGVTADVRFEGIDLDAALPLIPAALRPDLRGRATGHVEVEGALDELSGDASVRVDQTAWRDLSLGRLSAALRIQQGVVAGVAAGGPAGVSFLDLPPLPRTLRPGALPSLPPAAAGRWFVVATLDPRAPSQASIHGRAPVAILADLGRYGPSWIPESLQLFGELEARASGPLTDIAEWSGVATATGFALEQNGARVLQTDRLAATLEAGHLELDAELVGESSRLVAAPTWALGSGALGGSIFGDVEVDDLAVSDSGVLVGGRMELDMTLGGTVGRPLLEGQAAVTAGRLDTGGPYGVSDVDAAIVLANGQVRLDALTGRVGGTDFSATGAIPARALFPGAEETGTWRLAVDNLPLQPLLARSRSVSRLFGDGRASADIELRGRGLDWRTYRGELAMRSLVLRAGEYRIELAEPTPLLVESGRLRAVEEIKLRGNRTDLTLRGEVDPGTGNLDVRARGALGLEPLNVLSPNWGIGGRLDVDVRIAGQLPDPTYEGTGRFVDALLSPPPLRQPVEAIEGTLTFENRRVRFEDIEATFGGGDVTIAGEVFLRDSLPQSFRYTVDLERALLRLESDVRARVSGQLVHDGTPQDSLLSAQIDVEEGIYRRPWEADQAILELLEAPETDPDPLLAAIDLDLRVQGSDGFLIDNNLADIEVDADYNVRGTAADPVILGRSTILSGRLFWGANAFDVVQGVVEFNNPFETEPVFEIRARTAIRRYTVDLTFSGSLQRGVSFSYSSTPPLSDLDLFNLLALGEEPNSEVLRDSYGAAVGLQATRYLASQLFSEVERGAQRAFGLDRFLISPTLQGTETDATARFTVGKRINRNLYVTYSRLVSTSEDQLLTVEYQVSPDVRITGTREEDGSFGLDFLVQKRIR